MLWHLSEMAADEGDDEGEGTCLGDGDRLGSTDLEGSPSAGALIHIIDTW